VVDRSSELITRPLKDFADLGQIPEEEILAKTLPIFDNHRVAKRFTRRMQRVVKVPDSRMLQKVSPYLQAKGITRVLIDGNVYSL
jgi:SOS response regulatory protein OraA/RecX